VYVDKEELKGRIKQILQEQGFVSLAQVVTRFPLDLGLAELVTYLVIASESQQAYFNADDTEEICWRDESGKIRVARLPKIVFGRR
jgi:hypothetical protein